MLQQQNRNRNKVQENPRKTIQIRQKLKKVTKRYKISYPEKKI